MVDTNTNTATAVAQADNVSKSVSLGAETIEILREVSLTLYPGRTVSISGTSGSGKTTLLGLLAGLDLPSQGDLSLLGRQLGNLDEDARAELRCGQVGFVFQSFHLLPNLTALENVSLALEVVPGSSDIEQRSMAALQQVGLVARARHLPSQLSGGEQQRVAMARAIVAEPAILFADEPTGNLDHATSDQVIDMIFALCRDNDTALGAGYPRPGPGCEVQ